MYVGATRLLALLGAVSTLVFMVIMAHPWGENDALQSLSRSAGLLLLAVWATLPYLGILILAKRAVPVRAREILVLVGALIIMVGGLAAYVDAVWLNPDPQGGLAFMAVPLYQWLIMGLLAGLQWLAKKREAP